MRSGLAAHADRASHAADRRPRAESAADLFRAGRRHVSTPNSTPRGGRRSDPASSGPTGSAAARWQGSAHDRGFEPTGVHEWRKRTKDAGYHVRLLRDAAPSILEPLEDRFHDLSDALGDAHDLVVICEHRSASQTVSG